VLPIDGCRNIPGFSIRRKGETKFVAVVALVAFGAIVALVADVLGIGWV
jgi:hypothetical protein